MPEPDEEQPAETDATEDAVEHRADGLDLARAQMLGTAGASTTPAGRRPRRGSGSGSGSSSGSGTGWTPRGRRVRGEAQLSSAYPDGRDPQGLGSELGRLIDGRGWALDLQVRGVFARWAEIVGAEIGAHSTPESLVDGTLVVRTDSTAWATQLKLLAATVVKRLNEELGHGTVTVVEVLGPHAPSWKHGRRKAPGSRGPRDTYG